MDLPAPPAPLWIITLDDKFVSSFIIEQFRCLNKLEREQLVTEINKGLTCEGLQVRNKVNNEVTGIPEYFYGRHNSLHVFDDNRDKIYKSCKEIGAKRQDSKGQY